MAPPGVVQDITCRAICNALKHPLINIQSQYQVWEVEVTKSGVPAVLRVFLIVAFLCAF